MAQSAYTKFGLRSLDGGMVSSAATQLIDPTMGFAERLENLDITYPGLPRKRPSCQIVQSLPWEPSGVHQFVKLSTGVTRLLGANAGSVFVFNTATGLWDTLITGWNAAAPVEFLTIADQVVITNGVNPVARWDGINPVVLNVGARAATARTFLLFANNDLSFTAVQSGIVGNNIRITYELNPTTTATTTIHVTGSGTTEAPFVILVRLAWITDTTTQTPRITTLPVHIINAIVAHPIASTLVTAANAPSSDGSREVLVMPEIALTGGHNAVVGKYLTEYRLRAVMANRSQIVLSHTGDPSLFSPTASGSNAVSAFVSPDDGEEISGLLDMGEGGILIGKPSSLYGLFGYRRDNFVVDKLYPSVGVSSHRSMVFARPFAFFVGSGGVYRMQAGGIPEKISIVIQEYFDRVVNTARLSEAVAFYYDRQYIVSLPGIGTNPWVTLCYHIDREKWGVWSNLGEFRHICTAKGSFSPLFFTLRGILNLLGWRTNEFTDFTGSPTLQRNINAGIKTVELDAGFPEVDKDIGDVYILFRAEAQAYRVQCNIYFDGAQTPAIGMPLLIDNSKPNKQVVHRITVGRTARFMEIELLGNNAEPFTPSSVMFTFQPKEVL